MSDSNTTISEDDDAIVVRTGELTTVFRKDMASAASQVASLHTQIERLRAQLAAAQAECERLRTSEAELFDKCGELQRKVWKLEGREEGGGE